MSDDLNQQFESWGRYPKVSQRSQTVHSRTAPLTLPNSGTVLPYGLGRSYGDTCLNQDGTLLLCSSLDRFIDFDPATGVLKAEAGVSLEQILDHFVPRGWFLPVSPGTKFVTLGGAIANDIHGKNHHCGGTFGCHVRSFELLRSNGDRIFCSAQLQPELFSATIGGLGLTGLITWAEIVLKPISTAMIDSVSIKFSNLEEFFTVSKENEHNYEYTVSWVDCTTRGAQLGRGLYMAGNFAESTPANLPKKISKRMLPFPIEAPGWMLNSLSIKSFNTLYYNKQFSKKVAKTISYEPFFYPLDSISNWNRMYGKRGFFQYQMVVPYEKDQGAIRKAFEMITDSGKASFLAVLKTFGDIPSPGMLSFPRPGVTLALDFPNDGAKTLALFEDLDRLVRDAGGCVYPAKDARMSADSFRAYFPLYQEFSKYIDPRFSSSFWRRVAS